MITIEKRLFTIKLIESMNRYPAFSKKLGLADTSYYRQCDPDNQTTKKYWKGKKQWTKQLMQTVLTGTGFFLI